MSVKKVILASQSPRRHELIKYLGIDFIAVSSDTCEHIVNELSHAENVMNIAKEKAEDIASQYPDDVVLGFDTLVALNDELLGKPKDKEDAANMLRKLSGKTHQVYTGVAVVKEGIADLFYDMADVTFADLSDEEIYDYISTSEPFDKAGAYAIQGYGSKFVKHINGDYYTIMGFPVHKVYQHLKGL